MKLPTPAEWNKKHLKPSPLVEHAPVACPHCGRRMFYPFGRDFRENEDIVRCPKGCVQTTINRDT